MSNTQESKVQLEYISKCTDLVKEKYDRQPCFFIQNAGCQMNSLQTDTVAGIVKRMGYKEVEKEENADVVIYNTCTVRENANLKIYGHLGHLKSIKRHKPDMKIVLFGCMMQEPEVIEKIHKDYSFVDLVFGTHNFHKFPELFYRSLNTEGQIIDVWKESDEIVEGMPSDRKYSFKTGVNIMFGCNNFCSYCIVPYVRGREKSREPEDIIEEIKGLVADGVTEIMLLGQNVNSYGKTLEHPVTFARLLQRVEEIEGLKRIRFMTSHPKDLSDELIETMAKSKKVCHHLHLPMQSGSSRILKIMNRRYDKEKYLELVEKIRKAVPDISLTTDIIVGFPGETEEDFQDTLDVVEKSCFDTAFTFIYSKRSGTPAAKMENQVPEDVVKDRFDRLLSLVQEKGREASSRFEGTVQEILVEEESKEKGIFTGRTQYNLLVHFPGCQDMLGKYVKVKLDTCKGFYYMGTLAEE
ncbi:tRNA (N6-isopentenyl adenosine(37)-C2)-methylthiotransferase MiaB [Blautia luti]|uniref:tRNA-2-methylthio-N(6)-dimethylallyladenosine synthase n=1 Tax=Blautia luti DSM 14534 = JCM 17040 TaxID=649762 RepID=A0A844GIP6_9FIRM|nr:tRNA (N6-isopentenyl adenosine(37)-C2)-methylthiotransferase MiaB [Blautia luti DSM 14534 = JCM 17040]BEI60504.1 tRNA (N6-isopentenyl adenosine(37)-C2)-methylthiotransferase MiaB [Blautia luti]